MGDSQFDRAMRFRALHASGTFTIANAWDDGSAKILAFAGFSALATSSAAATLGRHDGHITRDEALAHARVICAATTLPVSVDLEKGFADAPAEVARTIALAAEVGLVGGSVEDFTGDRSNPIFDLGLAVERMAAAAEAVRALPFPFTLTARAENFLHGRCDLDDTIQRLQAYEQPGADVLFAPGLPDLDSVRRVVSSLRKPVSFMGRDPRQVIQRLRARGGRRTPHQLRDHVVPRRHGRTARSRPGDPRARHFGFVERAMPGGKLAKLLEG